MVSNNINRLLIGLLILAVVLLSYTLKLDFILIILILSLITYDFLKIRIINFFFICIIYFFTFSLIIFIPYEFFNIFFIFQIFLFILSFLNTKYKKFYFLLSLYVFCIILFYLSNFDRTILYLIIFISFLNDTTAYISGKLIGGPLIIPSISPKKTWSGTSISFLISSTILIYLNTNFFIAILVSISLFLGDIYFSYFKRYLNLKDFSLLLRGHGGILDRLDSMFFSVIIYQIYLFFPK